ncbi:MAG: BamA/TamA family outer membrane protein [Tannerellaceae bacterium]|nr:BamA/TamA family outer membrane protein [Tannerellaceae bacterium]
MRLTRTIIYIILLTALLASCTSTKYVGPGEYLLDKNIIHSDNKDYKAIDLKGCLQQQPNFKAFGLVKWQLYVYNWSSAKRSHTWWNRQWRRIGEAPIILDTLLVERSVDQLERFMENKGYLNARVTASIDTIRPKKAVVTYTIQSNEPYRISHYDIHLNDARIDSIAHLTASRRTRRMTSPFSPPVTDDYVSLVHEGSLFDRDVLDRERQRISTLLRRRGYYNFNKEYLEYLADTTYHQHGVDLEMELRPYRQVMADGSIRLESHKQYYIKDVTILTDYDPLRLDGEIFTPTDSVQAGDVKIIYGQSGRIFRPSVLRRANFIRPGRLYNDRTVDQTYSTLSSFRALSNVNFRYDEFMENDTMKLHAYILTTPAKVHGIGFDIEGTNSAGDLGFAASTNYQHRNLFKGSEVFSVKVRGAYEALTSGDAGSYWEIGGETSLTVPRFVFPFLREDFRRRLRATTEFRASYNRQRRPEYDRAILSGGWNYHWQDRSNTLARHTFKLLDVDYLFIPRIQADFLDKLHETTRTYNYTNQFIVGIGYTFLFNNYNPQNRQRNTHSFRFSVDMAGNLLYGLSKLTGAEKHVNLKEDGQPEGDPRYRLFGIYYSQFAKADFDFSKGIAIDSRNRIAYRFGVGVVYPYGNATEVPLERRYFSGGANSVRGWSVRSLGPGSMSKDSANFVTQAGDIRLDLSVEYRTKLFWKLELAGFLDAGNIWTIRNYESQPRGQFSFSRFYKEIAFSYGVGLRLDFDFFLIRFDTGFKVYDPQGEGKYKWAIANNAFFKDNCAVHFAVGYPF